MDIVSEKVMPASPKKNKAKQTGGLHVDRSLPVPRQKNI